MSAAPQAELDLDSWRAKTLERVLKVLTLVAVPAVAAGVWLSLRGGLPQLAAFDVVAWVLLAALTHRRVPYRARASFLVALFWSVGVVVLSLVGPAGVGHLWLTPAPILGGLLFGRRGLGITLLAVELALLVLAVWFPPLEPGGSAPMQIATPAWWVMVAASVACVALVVGLALVQLLEGLARSQGLLRQARDEARARQEAETSERRRFESLFEETPAALLLVEGGERISRLNQGARAVFGAVEPSRTPLSAILDGEVLDAAARACVAGSASASPLVVFSGAATGRRLPDQPAELELRVVSLELDGQAVALIGALDVGARVAAERELERALAEKVTLLQEVHHRVKNNLQIVSGLLEMQAAQLPDGDARRALLDSTHRVRSMAIVHQHLYASDSFNAIDLGAYVRTLVGGLKDSLAPDASLDFDVEPVDVPIDSALPCGLILNELVTNALKHGRDATGALRVEVSLRLDAGRVCLSVADHGQGLAQPWRELSRRSLGGRVITALSRQLRATLEVEGAPGARFRLAWAQPATEPAAASGDARRVEA